MDLYCIEMMDDSTIASFFDKKGMMVRFKAKRDEWVKMKAMSVKVTPMSIFSDDGSIVATTSILGTDESISLIDRTSCEKGIIDINDNTLSFPVNFMEDDDFVGSEGKENNAQLPLTVETSKGEKSPLISNAENVTDTSKTLKAPSNESMKSRPGTSNEVTPPSKRSKHYDLKTVLQSTPKGKIVLKKYDSDKGFLKDSTRDELVECILTYETGDDFGKVIPHDRLKFLAGEIKKCFPSESESTYFESKLNPQTKKVVTRGKLPNRYYNRRRSYSQCGAIEKKVVDRDSSTSRISLNLPKVVITSSMAGSLLWLEQNRGNSGNWEMVLRYWRDTSLARLDKLINEGGELTEAEEEALDAESDKAKPSSKGKKGKQTKKSMKEVARLLAQKSAHTYMSKYPVFEENTAYMLFEIDFNSLHPNVAPLALFNEWAALSAFVVQEVRKCDPEFLKDDTLTPGEKTLLTLMNLSKLFPIVNASGSKKGKKTWRPSHSEVTDSFVLLVPSTLALEEDKDKKRDLLRGYRLHMQPFAAVVGDIENPKQYLVCVDEFFYEVSSPLQAVDLVFKSFFALNTPYPAEAEQIWLFLQKCVYGFTTQFDGYFTGVNTKESLFKQFKSNGSSD